MISPQSFTSHHLLTANNGPIQALILGDEATTRFQGRVVAF